MQPKSLSLFTDTLPMTASDIRWHPQFPAIERRIALHLIGIHDATPRLARLKASHRRWLMTQSLYAMALQRRPDEPLSGLTSSRFLEVATKIGAVSRNTAQAYLKELLAYKFVREIPNARDQRVRLLEMTEASENAMRGWFMGHMACLDQLDDGSRQLQCLADPGIFILAQPRAAATLIDNEVWRYPRDSINCFLQSELGGMILHEFISRIGDFTPVAGKVDVGPINLPAISKAYFVSQTNLRRMIHRAEGQGFLGFGEETQQKSIWLSAEFIDDYLTWQAQKFAALDEAFHWSTDTVRRG